MELPESGVVFPTLQKTMCPGIVLDVAELQACVLQLGFDLDQNISGKGNRVQQNTYVDCNHLGQSQIQEISGRWWDIWLFRAQHSCLAWWLSVTIGG